MQLLHLFPVDIIVANQYFLSVPCVRNCHFELVGYCQSIQKIVSSIFDVFA